MKKLPQPLRGYLLLKPITLKGSSIYIISEDNKDISQTGEVVAVGGHTWYENVNREFPSPAKVGDIVIHSGYGYEKIFIENVEFHLCPFTRILAIL